MPGRIEDYAMIADTRTAALVGRDTSIDWLCLPRFDSPACFAALLGDERHGHWSLRPAGDVTGCERRYRDDTMVVEADLRTATGAVRVVDFMPIARGPEDDPHRVVRVVEGLDGEVEMHTHLTVRFQYGSSVPWKRREEGALHAVAGPDAVVVAAPVRLDADDQVRASATFTVRAGDRVPFVLGWHRSHRPPPPLGDALDELEATERWWRDWAARSTYDGPHRGAVMRSIMTLKALTYQPTGGVVAAATTSLPEHLGGVRNWDYRLCWLRDATLTLDSLIAAGYTSEAVAWREWLVRAAAGRPEDLQILYGPAGERWLPEMEVPWLPGYEGSAPVRVGNGAATQLQLDVYGQVMDALYEARRCGIEPDAMAWNVQRALMTDLEQRWREPDFGIWEIRAQPRHFTHSKMLAWVAFDRAVRTCEEFGLPGPVDRWRSVRAEIHAAVCENGFDAARNAFVRGFEDPALDASLLLMASSGFLPARDPRVAGTVDAIRRELCEDGLVHRYATTAADADGLPPGEGAFLPCSFWLVDALALGGRFDEAHELFDRLLELRNDVGLLPEEYDLRERRFLGNFPQALTHTSLVRSALVLEGAGAREGAEGATSAVP